MRTQTEAVYVKEADLGVIERKEPRTLHVQPALPPETVRHLGSTLLIGRYRPDTVIYWETNAYGYRVWMAEGMHRIYVVVMAELAAGHDLAGRVIANLAGVSQGYVSKGLKWLHKWNFIQILGVWRGRWGRTVAKLRQIIPPYVRGSVSIGGMIKRYIAPAIEEAWSRVTGVGDRELIRKPWTMDELQW